MVQGQITFLPLLICHEGTPVSLKAVLAGMPDDLARLAVLVGPEGGFTDEEVALFLGGGKSASVSLGSRILRTETAALVALSQILFARDT